MPTRRSLGNTGLEVTQLGFGALEIGRDWAPDVNPDPSHPTEAQAGRLLNELLDAGINFIDTAPAYWFSEEFIGKAISHRRDEYVLATKVGEHCDQNGSIYDYSGKATTEFIDRSLKLLRTDRIDLLQIHSASMEVLERGECLAAMQAARDAGKVLHIGMTGGVNECVKAIEAGGYETVQFPYNLLNLDAEKALLPLAADKGIGTIIMRGFAGGKLTSKFSALENAELRDAIAGFEQFLSPGGFPQTLAELALGYILAEPAIGSVIIGTRRIANLKTNLDAAEKPLPDGLRGRVREYAQSIRAAAW